LEDAVLVCSDIHHHWNDALRIVSYNVENPVEVKIVIVLDSKEIADQVIKLTGAASG